MSSNRLAVRLTAKRVERAAEASGTAQAAAVRGRAALVTARKLVPQPPSPQPDKLYAVIDGTGVPMTSKETAGRGYFENNAPRMRYHWFRRCGLFTGSGVVEAGCKTVIGQRLKLSGMHWTAAGAITTLRCQQASRPEDRIWPGARLGAGLLIASSVRPAPSHRGRRVRAPPLRRVR